MNIIISETGEIHGRGSMPHKWVSHLSKTEREHVKNGGSVLICDKEAHHNTQCGWKQVIYRNGRYFHREATQKQIIFCIAHCMSDLFNGGKK